MKIVALVVALICFALAVGYGSGTVQFAAHTPGPHVKHAVVFAVLGVVALVWMRFQSGASAPSAR
jgi:hypothetical protein